MERRYSCDIVICMALNKDSTMRKCSDLASFYYFLLHEISGYPNGISGPKIIKKIVLNSAEHEICPAYRSQIINNSKLFLATHN